MKPVLDGSWKLTGRHDAYGAYAGTVTIVRSPLRSGIFDLEAECKTEHGRRLAWRGAGQLNGGRLLFRLALARARGRARGRGSWLVTDGGNGLRGLWSLYGARAAATERLAWLEGPPRRRLRHPAHPPRLPKHALAVPLVPQAHNYTCGAATLTAILYYWQVYDSGEARLYGGLGTTKANGTEPDRIAAVARSFHLQANYRKDVKLPELWAALKRGDTVILDLQAWTADGRTPDWRNDWDDGHYVVLIGKDRHYAYFMDPSAFGGYGYMPLDELGARWHDTENPDGAGDRRVQHQAIVIGGEGAPLARVPGPLVRMQ